MRILGLDPGSRHTGFGLLDGERSRWEVLASGRVSPPRDAELPVRLCTIADAVGTLIEQWRPDVAVLETAFLGQNSRSLIVLAHARGALLLEIARARIPIVEYAPAEVKSAVTGNGRAEKAQVAKMVTMLLGLSVPVVADAADALAVALCYAARVRSSVALRRAGEPAT